MAMTDDAAAPAAEREPAHDPETDAAPPAGPKLLMVGAPDAPNCDGDGCVVPFAANLPANAGEDTEGSPK